MKRKRFSKTPSTRGKSQLSQASVLLYLKVRKQAPVSGAQLESAFMGCEKQALSFVAGGDELCYIKRAAVAGGCSSFGPAVWWKSRLPGTISIQLLASPSPQSVPFQALTASVLICTTYHKPPQQSKQASTSKRC